MKRLLLTIILLHFAFSAWAQTEPEWVVTRTKFEFKADSLLKVYDKTDNGAKFNHDCRDKYKSVEYTIEEKGYRELSKVISFELNNTYPMELPSGSYRIVDGRAGYNSTMWGFKIVLKKISGEECSLTYRLIESLYAYRKLIPGRYQYNVEHYRCAYQLESTLKDLSHDWLTVWREDKYHINVKISLSSDGICEIKPSTMWSTRKITDIESVKSIVLTMDDSPTICISNLKVERKSFREYIKIGDEMMRSEAYMDAATAYTKAISNGYDNYETYLRRAYAYASISLYNSAIEDCTKSLSYKETQEAYLLRAKIKYLKKDSSCIDDFVKGGPEGEAIAREIALELKQQASSSATGTGSGIILTTNGIFATNYHVIENAQRVEAHIRRNNEVKKYNAKILISDKQNDLALLQIEDPTFTNLPTLPYAVKFPTLDVGADVFALGYPMPDALGEEPKATNGIISSKTGYQGNVVTYQIQTPIQHGNSGGPLFDKQGNLVGITNAGIPDAENVGYAIKISYLQNLVEVSPTSVVLPTVNTISKLPLTEQIKRISPYVVLVKVY